MSPRVAVIAALGLLASGCTGVTFVSPEYAARPVQPLNQQAALAEINAYRATNGLPPLVLDARLSRAAAHSADQARRERMGHSGSDGSQPMDRAARAGYRLKIASENVAAGYKSFSDVMRGWEGSSGHRENLLRPNVKAAGIAMSQSSDGRAYWTLVLGAGR
jgi:uncharacterized protein YkwD